MVECKELTGKVVRALTLFEDGSYGPEISIDFTDGTNFSVCFGTRFTLEAKCTRDDGGQPVVFKDYSMPAVPR